jgi:hypothetical protein
VVGVPSSSATLNGAGHPTSHQEVRQSHMPAGVATFRGWVMSRMAWWKIVREGARRVLAEALAAEVDVYIAATPVSATSMSGGWWCATSTHQPGEVLTSAGAVEVVAPPVNDRPRRSRRRGTSPVLLGDPATPGICRAWTTTTCGPTGSTSTSARRSTSCDCSCSSAARRWA